MTKKWTEREGVLQLGMGLEKGIEGATRYEGLEHLKALNWKLLFGETVMIVGNHPSKATSIQVVGKAQDKLFMASRIGVLMSCKFWGEYGDMGWTGDLCRGVMEKKWGLDLIKIAQSSNTAIPNKEREAMNMGAVKLATRVIKSPAGVLVLYPEGTRSPRELLRAEEGLGRFAGKADHILPVVSEYGRWQPWRRVRFMEPLPGKRTIKYMVEEMEIDKESAENCYSDIIMTLIAMQLPEERRGYYLEPSLVVEGRAGNNGSEWQWMGEMIEVIEEIQKAPQDAGPKGQGTG